MRPTGTDGLRDLLADAAEICVMLAPGATRDVVRTWDLGDRAEVFDLTKAAPRPRQRDTVLLAVPDLVSLRRSIAAVPRMGTARQVAVWIGAAASRLPTISPRPEWPPLVQLVAASGDEQFVFLAFDTGARTRQVLLQIARAASASQSLPVSWPVLGAARRAPELWPPDPVTVVAALPGIVSPRDALPPDVVLLADDAVGLPTPAIDPVLGRPPVLRVEDPELTWEQLVAMSPADAKVALRRRGPLSLGAVDDQMINPIGFDRDPVAGLCDLTGDPARDAGLLVRDGAGRTVVRLDGDRPLSEADVVALRGVVGLRLDWTGARGPQAYCRLVASLACAGVPLVAEEVPDWAQLLLSPELVSTLPARPDLTDRLRREEHSVRQRRAALTVHATDPWRRSLARALGVQTPSPARVSVLLATRRPEMLPFALRQVSRQRGVDLELVLATHGFTADSDTLVDCDLPVTVVEAPSEVTFGEVLNQAAARAQGDLLAKMDDDDWYSPDFLADLVLAQRYSGAALVGCFPELTFIEPLWLTTRRPAPSEIYGPYVAGGTLLVERGFFRSCGGFRHTVRYVDAGLIAAVTGSGGSLYRMHGLDYVLRRGSQGHTWDPGLGYFLTDGKAADQWRGFAPSALVEVAPEDRPLRAEQEAGVR